MGFLKKILAVFLGFIALLAVVGFFLPSKAHIERSIVINKPREVVFAMLNDMRNFNQWSPWAELDPKTKYAFEGETGVGSKMTWASDDPNVGSGKQAIVESKPSELVKLHLEFQGQGEADVFYKLEADGANTKVTWGFDTDYGMNLMGRYFGLLMEDMLGPDYEKGLAKLKKVAEAMPAEVAAPPAQPETTAPANTGAESAPVSEGTPEAPATDAPAPAETPANPS